MKTDFFNRIADLLGCSPDLIVRDGIKFRDGLGPKFDNTGFWENHPGKELELWTQSRYRPLELTKDLNDDFAWDIRCETGLKPHTQTKVIGNRFYRNLMSWRFLIDNALVNGILPDYKRLKDEAMIDNFNLNPAARINCKKTLGGGSCSNSELRQHIELYGGEIQEQIVEMNPNVIYIGGFSGNIILDKIVRPIRPDLILVEPCREWIYYSYMHNTVVINGYHPSYWIDVEKIYGQLREALELFLCTECYANFYSTLHGSNTDKQNS
jgi:hypothetical protein